MSFIVGVILGASLILVLWVNVWHRSFRKNALMTEQEERDRFIGPDVSARHVASINTVLSDLNAMQTEEEISEDSYTPSQSTKLQGISKQTTR